MHCRTIFDRRSVYSGGHKDAQEFARASDPNGFTIPVSLAVNYGATQESFDGLGAPEGVTRCDSQPEIR